MTVITRWDPFREFTTVQDRLNRLFRESYGPEGREESLITSGFAPPVDVYEDEHNVTLKIEVPGIDEKDIDVRIENNVLTAHGERKFEKEEKEENFRRVESSTAASPAPSLCYDRGRREGFGEQRQGHSEDCSAEEGGSQAETDQGQRPAAKRPWKARGPAKRRDRQRPVVGGQSVWSGRRQR